MRIIPSKPGWLIETVNFRKSNLDELLAENRKITSYLVTMYQAIQPVGLINGQLFGEVVYAGSEGWSTAEKTKVLFVDCIISGALLTHDGSKLKDTKLVDEFILNTITHFGHFYQSIYPELKVSYSNLFGKRKESYQLAEIIAEKRVSNIIDNNQRFAEQFFHNGSLFLDVYIFSRWVNTQRDEIAAILFRSLLDDLRFSVLKVIAAAAHANKSIAASERDFLDSFIKSSALALDKVTEIRKIFSGGIDIRDLDLHPDNTWVIKKYFLEMAIITIWSDKVIDDDEMYFLERFCNYLELSPKELELSLLSIKQLVPNQKLEWK